MVQLSYLTIAVAYIASCLIVTVGSALALSAVFRWKHRKDPFYPAAYLVAWGAFIVTLLATYRLPLSFVLGWSLIGSMVLLFLRPTISQAEKPEHKALKRRWMFLCLGLMIAVPVVVVGISYGQYRYLGQKLDKHLTTSRDALQAEARALSETTAALIAKDNYSDAMASSDPNAVVGLLQNSLSEQSSFAVITTRTGEVIASYRAPIITDTALELRDYDPLSLEEQTGLTLLDENLPVLISSRPLTNEESSPGNLIVGHVVDRDFLNRLPLGSGLALVLSQANSVTSKPAAEPSIRQLLDSADLQTYLRSLTPTPSSRLTSSGEGIYRLQSVPFNDLGGSPTFSLSSLISISLP